MESRIDIGTRLALTLAMLELQITACTSKQGIEPLLSPTASVPVETTPTPDYSRIVPLSVDTIFRNEFGTISAVEEFSGDPAVAATIASQAEKAGISSNIDSVILMDLVGEKGREQAAIVINPKADEFYIMFKEHDDGQVDFVKPEDWTSNIKLRFIKLEFIGEGLVGIPDGKGGYTSIFSVDVDNNKADFVFNTAGKEIPLSPEAAKKVLFSLAPLEATPTPEAIQLPIVNKLDLEKFQELPYVSAEDAVSNKFDRFIMDSFQKGLIGDFPEHAEPFAPASPEKQVMFYDPATDVGSMWLLPEELKHAGRYTDLSIRPDFIAKAFFKTEIAAKDYVLFVQIWKNPDASTAFIKYVYPPEAFEVTPPNNPTFDRLAFLGVNNPNPVILTVPMLYPIENRPDFEKIQVYDENYYDNYWLPNFPEIEALRQQIYQDGKIPAEISRFLMYLDVDRISLADIP